MPQWSSFAAQGSSGAPAAAFHQTMPQWSSTSDSSPGTSSGTAPGVSGTYSGTASFDLPATCTEPVILNVDFDENEEVKKLRAKFNRDEKKWFVPPGMPLAPFAKWIPKETVRAIGDAKQSAVPQPS